MSYTVAVHFNYSLPRAEADETIRLCIEELSKIDFDAIAFCGMSGALIAPVLAHKMGKELLMVRKNAGNDGSHSAKFVEGYVRANQKVVIIDDLISTGATLQNIVRGLNQFFPSKLYEIVGVILYDAPRRPESVGQMLTPPTERMLKWKSEL